MKKVIFYLLVICCFLTACASSRDVAPTTETTVETEAIPETTAAPAVISPLPGTIDVSRLDNCTVAVSLEPGGVSVGDDDIVLMNVTVFAYDLYDMVDIAKLKVGDTILIRQQEVTVTALERSEFGNIVINGGLDVGGYELRTDEDTVYYETGYSDRKAWQEVVEATLPLSSDFVYTDSSDLDAAPVICGREDFLTEYAERDYFFTPYNTTITIENGWVTAMERVYTP